jgi:hypothetical protein
MSKRLQILIIYPLVYRIRTNGYVAPKGLGTERAETLNNVVRFFFGQDAKID